MASCYACEYHIRAAWRDARGPEMDDVERAPPLLRLPLHVVVCWDHDPGVPPTVVIDRVIEANRGAWTDVVREVQALSVTRGRRVRLYFSIDNDCNAVEVVMTKPLAPMELWQLLAEKAMVALWGKMMERVFAARSMGAVMTIDGGAAT